MEYRSLVRFFEYAGLEPEDLATTTLPRMKKLAQAEFALQPDGVLMLEGISFTGNDVSQELDHPDAQQRLQYHLSVWEHKGLLELLEQDHLHMDTMDQWYVLHQDEGFRYFISPYFATAFHSAMSTLLHSRDLYSAASWMDYLVFVRPEDEEQAVRSVRLFLEDALRLFRNLNDTSYGDRLQELEVWRDDSWSLFINKLPPSLAPYADELANAIINFTVRVQKVNPKLCYELSAGLIKLRHIDYSLKRLILNNHEVYRKKGDRGSFHMPYLYPIVIGLIILVRVLIGMGSSNSFQNVNPYVDHDSGITNEKSEYEGIRLFHEDQYRYSKSPTHIAGPPLDKAVFSDKPVYLFIESWPTDSLYPMALVNNTRERIKVDIISAVNVSNVTVGDHDILCIQPDYNRNLDMVLTFRQEDPRLLIIPKTDDLQYLHVATDTQRYYHTLYWVDSLSISLPVLQRDKLKDIPLVITISERDSGYTFSLKGKGEAVNYRALPAGSK